MSFYKLVNFQGSSFIKTFGFILLFMEIIPSHAYVPQDQLFPYLTSSTATQFDFQDDAYTSVPFKSTFQFLGKNYSMAYINGNGVITFGQGSGVYNHECKPNVSSIPTIAAYMADAYMSYDKTHTKLLYKFQVTNPTSLQAAQKDVDVAFPSLKGKFSLRELSIVTWLNIPCPSNDFVHLRNTFQAVLATDYKYSFLLLYYTQIRWPSRADQKTPAQVGIFGGSANVANTYILPGSCTYSLVNIAGMSNIEKPGKFVFRVDNDIKLPLMKCNPISVVPRMEPLQFLPAVVPVMGSIPLLVRGFHRCLNHVLPRISCTFHDINRREPVIVAGLVVSDQGTVFCHTPAEFYSLGRVRIDLALEFSYGLVVKSYGFVYVVNTLYSTTANISANLLNENNKSPTISLSVSWDRHYLNNVLQHILANLSRSLADVPSTVNITIMELSGSRWQDLYVVNNVTNSGQFKFSPPQSVQRKLVFDKHLVTFPTTVKFTGAFQMKGGENLSLEFVTSIGETTAVLGQLKKPSYYETKCQFWLEHEPTPPHDALPCPYDIRQATVDWRFSYSKSQKQTKVFLQSVPSPSGAASRCVYGDTGELVNNQPSDSFLFRISPNDRRTFWGHFEKDMIPFEQCCRWNNFSRFGCRKNFFPNRHLHKGSMYEFPVPFRATCTSHVTTMDGTNYSLNGLGFYWLFKLPSLLDVQVLLDRSFGGTSGAHKTLITSVVMKRYLGGRGELSTKFQLSATAIRPMKLLMWMDEEPLNFYYDKVSYNYEYLQDNFTLYHDGISVQIHGTTEALFSFSTGVSIKVTVSEVYGFLNIVGQMSKTMMVKKVTGLLGNFIGDSENESETIFTNIRTKQFFNDFVEKWRVAPNESLFVTPPQKNYSSYYTLPLDFQHNSPASSETFEKSSRQAHQDFGRLIIASKIGSNQKECSLLPNIPSGGFLGESLSLNSTIQVYCDGHMYPKIQQAEKDLMGNTTFVCVESDAVSKLQQLSANEMATETLWVSTDSFLPLSWHTIECLPKEITVVDEFRLSERVIRVLTSVVAGSLVIVALAGLIYILKTRTQKTSAC